MMQSSQFDGVAFDPFSFQKDGLASAEVRRRPVSGSVGFYGNACDCSAGRSARSGFRAVANDHCCHPTSPVLLELDRKISSALIRKNR